MIGRMKRSFAIPKRLKKREKGEDVKQSELLSILKVKIHFIKIDGSDYRWYLEI